MAVALVHRPTLPRLGIARTAVRVPLGVTLAAVAASASDLLAQLQRLAVLEGAAFALTAFAAAGLAAALLHAGHGRWIALASLVFAVSALLRLVGVHEAALVNVLGVVAMGLGGVFRDGPPAEDALESVLATGRPVPRAV